MNDREALLLVEKIFQMVFNRPNCLDLGELFQKLADGMRLPRSVRDIATDKTTWSIVGQAKKFITQENVSAINQKEGWMRPRRPIHEFNEILKAWDEINLVSAERQFDSVNIAKSDAIYACENAYRCADCHGCKNIVYTEGCVNSEYLLVSARSANCNFCIKTDDSGNCSNSYQVVCSNKIINSLFIQDCYDLYECMFCAHIAAKKYCIANMEFEQDEYYEIKTYIIDDILRKL